MDFLETVKQPSHCSKSTGKLKIMCLHEGTHEKQNKMTNKQISKFVMSKTVN